jgi:hypothetical protein
MKFSLNAVKAGVGIFASFGIALGLLISISIAEGGEENFEFGIIIAVFGLILAMVISPILATIVGAIIAKDFDDEGDAALNGAIAGTVGTALMVTISIAFLIVAMAGEFDDDGGGGGFDDDGGGGDSEWGLLIELVVKGLLPSAVSGALGAFVGFRYLWAQLPHSEMHSMMYPPSPPQFP